MYEWCERALVTIDYIYSKGKVKSDKANQARLAFGVGNGSFGTGLISHKMRTIYIHSI